MTKLNTFAAALETGEFISGKLCQDCYFAHANGEDDRPDQSVIEMNYATYDFTIGHLHSGRWSDCYHAGTECEDDCDCETTTFSNAECSMCETMLAGSRHDCIMIRRDLLDTKMTQEQFNKLSELCKRYDVPMAIADYVVSSQDSFMMKGWAEGWVGGPQQNKKTIFVGVSPQGDSHS